MNTTRSTATEPFLPSTFLISLYAMAILTHSCRRHRTTPTPAVHFERFHQRDSRDLQTWGFGTFSPIPICLDPRLRFANFFVSRDPAQTPQHSTEPSLNSKRPD